MTAGAFNGSLRRMPKKRTMACKLCGKKFTYTVTVKSRVYCSRECSNKNRKNIHKAYVASSMAAAGKSPGNTPPPITHTAETAKQALKEAKAAKKRRRNRFMKRFLQGKATEDQWTT